jgi:endoglucanase
MSAHNVVRNASFDGASSLPWMPLFLEPAQGDAAITSGAYCMTVKNAGAHPWDAQFRHREMTIERGHRYAVRFKIGSTAPTSLLAQVAMSGAPYKAYWRMAVVLEGRGRGARGDARRVRLHRRGPRALDRG